MSANGRMILMRIGERGRWNLRMCKTHTGDPMIEFFDGAQDAEKFGVLGQFVARYYVRTLTECVERRALPLHLGISAWTLTVAEMDIVMAWLDGQGFRAGDSAAPEARARQ